MAPNPETTNSFTHERKGDFDDNKFRHESLIAGKLWPPPQKTLFYSVSSVSLYRGTVF
jgi:hypothetical protein